MNRELNQEKPKQEGQVKKILDPKELKEIAKKFWEDLKKPQNFQG